MIQITSQERLFLKRFLNTLHYRTTSPNEKDRIPFILQKLAGPFFIISEEECLFLTQKLTEKMEDACDCRNEPEVDFILHLLNKLKRNN